MMIRAPLVVSSLLVLAVFPLTAGIRVDHSKFSQLKGPFSNGPQVTQACLKCHSQIGSDLLTTSHWLWKGGEKNIGKANLINNFCIGIQSNEAQCTKCHIGYGWKDKTFNFKDPSKIDCLICHDTTGQYTRTPLEDEPLEWADIARNVGPTSVQNCGSCHFNGGGGEGVKHGDLDHSLLESHRALDIHMDQKGLNFTCSTCHKGEEIPHHIRGKSASVSVQHGNELSCETCHGQDPHGRPFIYRTKKEKEAGSLFHKGKTGKKSAASARLNWHARRVACQTCHIPKFSTEMPTKTWWDWSTAGRRDENGQALQEVNEDGDVTYLGNKGSFVWGKNLKPEYHWSNGLSSRYLLGEKFDPSKPLVLNAPMGGPYDAASKIWPFKIMRGKQIYDAEHNTLIQPKIYGEKGSGAYRSDFDWDKSARAGMAYAGLPYSGRFGFIETEMYWPLSHMTQESGKTLSCTDCHNRQGRLKDVPGVYIPGQSRAVWLDILGWLAVGLSLLGVLLHGILRLVGPRGNRLRQKLFGRDKS